VRLAARFCGLLLLAAVALQLYFLLRVATMIAIDPRSTTFQRSEAWRLLAAGRLDWSQEWTPYAQISVQLKRAVIAAEDADFAEHAGLDWDALERAWERNQKAESRALARKSEPRLVGGSTITQQMAKNLFLSGERHWLRKVQEAALAFMIEALLDKQRILEIYLNSVEWGEGVFGAEAAARRYFRTSAAQLSATQAARLAVMLPAPKRFEKRPGSPYMLGRAASVQARMGDVEAP